MTALKRFRRDLDELRQSPLVASVKRAGTKSLSVYVALFRRNPQSETLSGGTIAVDGDNTDVWNLKLEAEEFPFKVPKLILQAEHPLHLSLQGHGPSLLNPHVPFCGAWSPFNTLTELIQKVHGRPLPSEGSPTLKTHLKTLFNFAASSTRWIADAIC